LPPEKTVAIESGPKRSYIVEGFLFADRHFNKE